MDLGTILLKKWKRTESSMNRGYKRPPIYIPPGVDRRMIGGGIRSLLRGSKESHDFIKNNYTYVRYIHSVPSIAKQHYCMRVQAAAGRSYVCLTLSQSLFVNAQ